METLTDADLMALAGEGCPEAMGLLFDRHYSPALSYARGLAKDGHAAQDLAAEAFAKVVERIRSGRQPTSFRAYLFTSVRNEWIDRYRTTGRVIPTAHLGSGLVPDEVDQAAGRGHHQDFTARVAERQVLAEALGTLPLRQRVVIWRTIVEGHRLHDVAEELGISENAAAALAHRARRALRTAYANLCGPTSPTAVSLAA